MAGADRIHGCALGLGERVGNTHLDLLLVNFKLLGLDRHRPQQAEGNGRGDRRGNRHGQSRRTIPCSATMLFGPPPACTPPRSSRRSERRRVARQPRLLGRACRTVRLRADHRDRTDERRIQRRLLAGAARDRARRLNSSEPSSREPRPATSPRRARGLRDGEKQLAEDLLNSDRDVEALGIPCRCRARWRGHVAEQRRRGDDGRAGEVAFAAEAHAVLPVAVERRDRALRPSRARPGPGRSTARTTTARISPPTERNTSAIDSPPSRGSGCSICAPTPPEPGKTTNSFARLLDALLARRRG